MEDVQFGVDESDLAPNAAQRIPSGIRTHQNGHAAGRRPRKVPLRQRQINYRLADPDSILQIPDHSRHFIGPLLVSNALPDPISIAEEPAFRSLIQHYR